MRYSTSKFIFDRLIFLAVFTLALGQFPLAEAQLSQLYFDKPATSDSGEESAENKAKVILKSNSSATKSKPTSKFVISDIKSAKAHINSTKARTKKYISKVVRIFLMPILGGPETDSENEFQITSHISWTPSEGEDCSKPLDLENRNKKSMAIEEVVRKFTGDNELAAKHCGYRCSPGKTPILSSLEMGDMKGGSFAAIYENSACSYRMTRPEDRYWSMFEVLKITCRCMGSNS